MRQGGAVARNYAAALFAAALQAKKLDAWGELLDAVAGAVAADERIAIVLDSPRVAKTVKQQVLADALAGVAPPQFVRFLQAVVRRGRQGLIAEIAQAYQDLTDRQLNRVHAGVTLARDATPKLRDDIVERLTKALGKEVRPHFRTDKAILGGVVVRVGDRVYDGSIKRRLAVLRRRMLTGE